MTAAAADHPIGPDVRPVRVVVIDAPGHWRATLAAWLGADGCDVEVASCCREAVAAARHAPFDLALLQLDPGRADGLARLPDLFDASPGIEVVIVTFRPTMDEALRAVRLGASDYRARPFGPAQAAHVLGRLRARRDRERRTRELEVLLGYAVSGPGRAAESPATRAVRAAIDRAARTDAPVIVRGERGTGKGILARLIHLRSLRAGGPFVALDGAARAREGVHGSDHFETAGIEKADQGTLFLEEVGSIGQALDGELLALLRTTSPRDRSSRPRADVRIVAATRHALDDGVAGRSGLRLFRRRGIIDVTLPPLRERRRELPALTRHFLGFFAGRLGRRAPELSPATEAALLAHSWPDNLRGLREEMERAVALHGVRVLEPEHLF